MHLKHCETAENKFKCAEEFARNEWVEFVDFKRNTAAGVFGALYSLSKYFDGFYSDKIQPNYFSAFYRLYKKARDYGLEFDPVGMKIEFPTLKSKDYQVIVISTITVDDFQNAVSLFVNDSSKFLKSVGENRVDLTTKDLQKGFFTEFIQVIFKFVRLHLKK